MKTFMKLFFGAAAITLGTVATMMIVKKVKAAKSEQEPQEDDQENQEEESDNHKSQRPNVREIEGNMTCDLNKIGVKNSTTCKN